MDVYQIDYNGKKHRFTLPVGDSTPHDCWDGESDPESKNRKQCHWHGKRIRIEDVHDNLTTAIRRGKSNSPMRSGRGHSFTNRRKVR